MMIEDDRTTDDSLGSCMDILINEDEWIDGVTSVTGGVFSERGLEC